MSLDLNRPLEEIEQTIAQEEKRARFFDNVGCITISIVFLVGLSVFGVTKYNDYRIDKILEAKGVVIDAEMTSNPLQRRWSKLYGNTYLVTYKFTVDKTPYKGSGTILNPIYIPNSQSKPIKIRYDPDNPNNNKPADSPNISEYILTDKFLIILLISASLALFTYLVKKIVGVPKSN